MRQNSIRVWFRNVFLVIAIVFCVSYITTQSGKGNSLGRMAMSPGEGSTCGKEKMKFVAYNRDEPQIVGANFSCDLLPFLDKWQISDKFKYELSTIDPEQVVFVTYSSSNHFAEARASINSIRSEMKNKIVFYDLGLTQAEINELKKVCNLEVRKFNYSEFPMFVEDLFGYNFKPIIMAEVFHEFEAFWIMDTSVRYFNTTPFMKDFYNNITSKIIEPLAQRHPSSHSIYAATDKRMYNYLPITEKLSKELEMLDANTIFIARSDMSREAVKWNVLCALTQDCMAPSGTTIACSFQDDRYNFLAGCHRYDQSSISIIMASLLERDGFARRDRVQDDSMRNFSTVLRGRTAGTIFNFVC